MRPIRGLLLLPLPPQRTTFSHISTALYPSIQSTISHIRNVAGPNDTSILEIAVPITRVKENSQTHLELFKRTNPLLARIYRLISTICRELHIPPGALDARVLLTRDVWGSSVAEAPCPCGIIDYAVLANTEEPWTHVFAVESEAGEDVLRKFTALAHERGLRPHDLFAAVRRVPSGMQIYLPDTSAPIKDTVDADYDPDYDADPDADPEYHPTAIVESEFVYKPLRPRHIVVVISGDVKDQFRDKHVLTMALLAIGRLKGEEAGVKEAEGKEVEAKDEASMDEEEEAAERMTVAVSKVDLGEDLKQRILDFLACVMRMTISTQPNGNHGMSLMVPLYAYRDMKKEYEVGWIVGTLVVSDRYPRLARRWADEGSTAIMLESIEPVEIDDDN